MLRPQGWWYLLLAALGGFAIAAATTLLVVGPSLVRLPAGEVEESTATGRNLVVFYPGDLQVRQGVEARLTQTVSPGPGGGRDGLVPYRTGSVVTDSRGTLLSAAQSSFCVDPDTRVQSPGCGVVSPGTDPWATFAAPLWTFPAGTEQRDYTVTDPTLPGAPAQTLRYTRDGRIDGVPVQRYEQTVAPTVVGTREVPGTLTGGPEGSTITADVVYQGQRSVWVEPVSGTVVWRAEQRTVLVVGPGNRVLFPLFLGSLVRDPADVAAAASRAAEARDRISLVGSTAPTGLGVLGVLLLAGGVWLAVRRDRPRTGGTPDPVEPEREREPAGGPVP